MLFSANAYAEGNDECDAGEPGWYYDDNDDCVYDDNQYCIDTEGEGYYWDDDAGNCVTDEPGEGNNEEDFECPLGYGTLSGPLAEFDGGFYDFDGDGIIRSNECFSIRIYSATSSGNIKDAVNNMNSFDSALLSNPYLNITGKTIQQAAKRYTWDSSLWLNSSEDIDGSMSLAFCLYDEETGNYDLSCSFALVSDGGDNTYIMSVLADSIGAFSSGDIDQQTAFLTAAKGLMDIYDPDMTYEDYWYVMQMTYDPSEDASYGNLEWTPYINICGTGEIDDGDGGCMCDESNGYYGDSGYCCDTNNGYTWDGSNCALAEYTVTLYQNADPNNDTLNATVTVNTGSAMPTTNTSGQTLTPPTREGYIFNGYYDARTGGTKYYSANMTSAHTWDKGTDSALYAQWLRTINTVTLYQNVDPNNDTLNATVTVNTGSAMPTTNTSGQTLTAPTREGYIFNGYWSERTGGTKYYNTNMTSARSWNTYEDGVLYAQWLRTNNKVTLYQNADGNDNTINENITVNTGSAMPTTNTSGQTLTAPTREGYIFTGYYDARTGGNMFYNPNMAAMRSWGENADGALYAGWTEVKFTLTTTSTMNLYFHMSAKGKFYVDCGDGGTLKYEYTQGTKVYTGTIADKTISRSDTKDVSYHCEWSKGVHTIKFGGLATGYSVDSTTPTISFSSDSSDVASIHGSLGAIFPTLNDVPSGLSKQPRFYETFRGCSRLTSLPTDSNGISILFSGISGTPVHNMFSHTFYGCSGLTSLPSDLFNGISGAADYMFSHTFYGCSGLTSLPSGLFSEISSTAPYMFLYTFAYCDNLTSVPADLFAGVSGAPKQYMFKSTFENNTKLNTFDYDNGVTTSYIPPQFFGSITTTPNATDFMTNVFYNTGIATSCPANTYKHTTGFESYWNYTDATTAPGQKVSCTPCPNNGTSPAGSTSVEQCVGAQSCPANYHVPANHSEMCFPSVLHLDDTRQNDIVYLKDAATTSPALNIDIDDDGVNDGFANLTTTRTVMTDTSSHYLTVPVNGVTYYVCDDTSCPSAQ